jgi:hypothetical protein
MQMFEHKKILWKCEQTGSMDPLLMYDKIANWNTKRA